MALSAEDITKFAAIEKHLHDEVHRTFSARSTRNSKSQKAWSDACEKFHRYKSPFERYWSENFKRSVKLGNRNSIDELITFLELDPYFYTSGYLKTRLIRIIKNSPRTKRDDLRLRMIIWNRALGPNRREFTDYCRLAARITTPDFQEEVSRLVSRATDYKPEMLFSYIQQSIKK